MDRFFARLRTRFTARAIAATTYCEGCGSVCTPACRQNALWEHAQLRAQELGLYRH